MNIVTAHHLQSWSNSLTARAELPGVVASLIRASCQSLHSYRFPNGEASQTHGFDGVAEVSVGNVFVPQGRSIWEFGTGKGLPQLDVSTRARLLLAIRQSAENVDSDDAFQLWSKLHDLVQKHRYFQDAKWALKPDQLKPIEELCDAIKPSDPVRQIQWLFNEYVPKIGSPKGKDYIGEANHDRSEALRGLLEANGVSAVLDLARQAKLPHFVGIALAEAAPGIETLKEAMSLAIVPNSALSEDFAIALSSVAHKLNGTPWDTWIAGIAEKLDSGPAANLFLRWNDSHQTWDFVALMSPDIQREYWSRKPVSRPPSQEDLLFAFAKYVEVGRFTAILNMVSHNENLLSTPQCVETLQGLIQEFSKDPWKMQGAQYEVVHMIQALQQRDDVNLEELAALEYQYLPMLEFQAEPAALNHLLGSSPQFFVSVICDAFSPASGKIKEITEDRRLRARLAYQLLQSIKTVPGFFQGSENLDHLRSWVSAVRALAKEADRAVITDQQIGQILAYAPFDTQDAAWPSKPIRELIEEMAANEIEKGIAICRFNQRGTFTKNLLEGGQQERAIANQYLTGRRPAAIGPVRAPYCGRSLTIGSTMRSGRTAKLN